MGSHRIDTFHPFASLNLQAGECTTPNFLLRDGPYAHSDRNALTAGHWPRVGLEGVVRARRSGNSVAGWLAATQRAATTGTPTICCVRGIYKRTPLHSSPCSKGMEKAFFAKSVSSAASRLGSLGAAAARSGAEAGNVTACSSQVHSSERARKSSHSIALPLIRHPWTSRHSTTKLSSSAACIIRRRRLCLPLSMSGSHCIFSWVYALSTPSACSWWCTLFAGQA